MSSSRNAVPERNPRHFPEPLKGNWSLVSLEKGTCCFRAAQYFSSHGFETPPAIITEPTFFAARNRAQERPRSILLLPCVHEIFSAVYTYDQWNLLHPLIFHIPNPPLYLAKAKKPPTHDAQACATIKRLRTLIPESLLEGQFIDVDTTQDAARAVAVDRRCGYCITNHDGMESYELTVVKELKQMIMGWYPFTYSPTQPRIERLTKEP